MKIGKLKDFRGLKVGNFKVWRCVPLELFIWVRVMGTETYTLKFIMKDSADAETVLHSLQIRTLLMSDMCTACRYARYSC